MTKEKIIEIMKENAWARTTRCYADRIEEDDWVLKNEFIETNADELLALFEQEKKEIVERKDRTMQELLEVQKREIFRAVHYKLLGSGHSYLIKDLAKEYGVEL